MRIYVGYSKSFGSNFCEEDNKTVVLLLWLRFIMEVVSLEAWLKDIAKLEDKKLKTGESSL